MRTSSALHLRACRRGPAAAARAARALRWIVLALLVGMPMAVARATAPGSSPPPAAELHLRAEITESGVYESLGEQVIVPAPRTAMGVMSQVAGFRLLFPATTLEAAKGATFGFRYRLVGAPAGMVRGIETRIKHPPITGGTGPSRTESVVASPAFSVDGIAEGAVIYSLDEPGEIVRGRWTFEVLHNGRVLVSQDFLLR